MTEDEERFLGDDVGVGVEEEVFDPADIAVGADSLAAVAERVGRACLVLVGLREAEELESFGFEHRHELHWDAMVDNLKEPELFASPDYESTGPGVGQVDHWDSTEEARGRLACFDQ